jgi:hypothetical protein
MIDGSGTGSVRVVDPDPASQINADPDPQPGSRRAKITNKIEKRKNYHVLKLCMFSFEG